MVRGTFANIRIKNQMLDGVEGGFTLHVPSGEQMSIYDAAMKYKADGTPLVVIAGKEYGTGSSRDWAAKGTLLLGVKAVIAESFERIHRSNLVGMGVLPLQFTDGENAQIARPRPARKRSTSPASRRRRVAKRPSSRHGDGGEKTFERARDAADAEGTSSSTATAASCSTCCASSRRSKAAAVKADLNR